jgi:ribosomal-protein-alanine N-acetyltransferase
LVLDSGGVASGFAAIHLLNDEAHLLNLMVDPALRRQGIGSQVLRDLFDWLKEAGARTLTLDVDPANRAAVSLYEGAGFVVLERRSRSYPGGEDALVMRKAL